MRRFSLLGTLTVVVTLAVALAWLGLTLIGRSFVVEGESVVDLPGLRSEATIVRDGYGIPYITASNEDDLWFGLGYAHAQDRLWQMDLMRRAGEGRLSEIFGRRTLDYDGFQRTVGIRRVAEKILAAMPKRTRRVLESYARGVNAYISSQNGRFAFEFDALGYEPEPWTPLASTVVMRMLGWELNLSMWTDIVYQEIHDRVDSARFAEILPYYPTDAPTIVPGGQRAEPQALQPDRSSATDSTRRDTTATGAGQLHEISAVTRMLRSMDVDVRTRSRLGLGGPLLGSNAWALSGSRSLSGRAMLANDPHLPHSAPCRWYQTVLTYPGGQLAGVTLPGIPFVISGRNSAVAWGLTAMMADQTDFYFEKLDSARHQSALHDGKWEPLSILRDTIVVRDSVAVPIVVRLTRHGPIVSDLDPWVGLARSSDTAWRAHGDTAVSMRWAGADATQELAALDGINRSSNLAGFSTAARLGGVPGISIAYADSSGAIAFVPAAAIPVREPSFLPRPGWDSRYNWRGMQPMAQIPSLTNPASGYIVCANNKVSNSLPFHIGEFWEDPSRAFRLQDLLAEGDGLGITDFIQIQADIVSPISRSLVGYLLQAFPDSNRQGSAVRRAIARLRTWDGGMREDGPEAAIVAVWIQTVVDMTYRDELGTELFDRWVYLSQNPMRALRYHAMIDSRWFDNTATRDRVERRDDIFRSALGAALDSLHRRFDTWDFSQWRFGPIHTVTFRHPFGTRADIQSIVNIGPFELGGAYGSVNSGEWDFAHPYAAIVGPTMRQIIDFGDSTALVRSVITSGESGQPLSGFYSNQTVLWLSNGYVALGRHSPSGTEIASKIIMRPVAGG